MSTPKNRPVTHRNQSGKIDASLAGVAHQGCKRRVNTRASHSGASRLVLLRCPSRRKAMELNLTRCAGVGTGSPVTAA